MRPFLLALILILCTLTRAHADSGAAADTKSEAQRFFQAGVSLQKTEDFEAAIAAYETSLQLFPTKSALFNLANCQRAAHRYADAWNSLHRLRAEFGPELVEPMASTSAAQLEELENLTGLLRVDTHPPGATVSVDDKAVGETPLATPIRITVGSPTVEAVAEGHLPYVETVRVSPRQLVTLNWELQMSPTAEPTPEKTTSDPVTPTGVSTKPDLTDRDRVQPTMATTDGELTRLPTAWRTVGWVSAAAGLLSVAAGARTGALALDVDDRLREQCEAGHCSRAQSDQIERLERLALSSNLFIGAGAVLLATGVTLVFWPSADDASDPVHLSLGPTTVHLGGSF